MLYHLIPGLPTRERTVYFFPKHLTKLLRARTLRPFHQHLRSLRSFFSWLVFEEVLEVNPFARVKLPRVSRKVIKTFSLDNIQKLLSAIDSKAAAVTVTTQLCDPAVHRSLDLRTDQPENSR